MERPKPAFAELPLPIRTERAVGGAGHRILRNPGGGSKVAGEEIVSGIVGGSSGDQPSGWQRRQRGKVRLQAAEGNRAIDVVVLENPTYFGAIDVFRSRGTRLIAVPLDRTGVDVQALTDAVATSAPALIYVTPTCNNPTGSVLSPERRRSLASFLEGFGGYVIEDQTLTSLLYEDEIPPSIAALAGTDKVVVVGSMSKLFWGRLRVGWIRGPETLISRLARLKVMADFGSSLPSQLIASRLLPKAAEVQARRREQLRERWRALTDLVAELLPSWELWPASGGPFAWTKLPGGDADRLTAVCISSGPA